MIWVVLATHLVLTLIGAALWYWPRTVIDTKLVYPTLRPHCTVPIMDSDGEVIEFVIQSVDRDHLGAIQVRMQDRTSLDRRYDYNYYTLPQASHGVPGVRLPPREYSPGGLQPGLWERLNSRTSRDDSIDAMITTMDAWIIGETP